MLTLILKRLLWGIPVLWAVATITFIIMHVVPGGPFDTEKQLPPEIKANIEEKYHLDKPIHEQYFLYLGNLVMGDLGPSYKYTGRSVNDVIKDTFPVSIKLGLIAFILAIIIGTGTGILSAVSQNYPPKPPLIKGGLGGVLSDEDLKKTGVIPPGTTLAHFLQRPEINYSVIEKISPPAPPINEEIMNSVEIEVKYDGYIKRQLELVDKYKNMENKQIPTDFDYTSISGLSREIVEKLEKIKPVSLGQASRISGITPAAVSIIAITIAKKAREKKFHVEQ